MKYFTLLLLLIIVSPVLKAQNEDCDGDAVQMSLGNSWLEAKRSWFGPNCMAVALNKAINSGFPLTLATGEQVPTIDVFQPTSCNTTVGCWQGITRGSYNPVSSPIEATGGALIYSRPAYVQCSGNTVTLIFYSTPIDTTWIPYDDAKLQEELTDEYDKWDEIVLSLQKHNEEGITYYKLVGTINLKETPIEPSALGEAIQYYFNFTCDGLIDRTDKIGWEELDHIRDTKQTYYSRGAMSALLGLSDNYAAKQSKSKEGSWSFSYDEGARHYWIDNEGTHLRLSYKIKADAKKLEAVAAKMTAWVKDNPFKNGVTTAIKHNGGDQYWMYTECKYGDKTGSDIFEDCYEEFVNKYTEKFQEEVEDAADDIE